MSTTLADPLPRHVCLLGYLTHRYIYIPLGGSSRQLLTTLLVFSFVALWHDLSFRLLAWGWLISLFVVPEVVAGWGARKVGVSLRLIFFFVFVGPSFLLCDWSFAPVRSRATRPIRSPFLSLILSHVVLTTTTTTRPHPLNITAAQKTVLQTPVRTRWGRQHTHDDGRESRRVRAWHGWDEGGGGEVGGELGRCVFNSFSFSFPAAFCPFSCGVLFLFKRFCVAVTCYVFFLCCLDANSLVVFSFSVLFGWRGVMWRRGMLCYRPQIPRRDVCVSIRRSAGYV